MKAIPTKIKSQTAPSPFTLSFNAEVSNKEKEYEYKANIEM